MTNSGIDTLGFFSPEVEEYRHVIRSENAAAVSSVESLAAQALTDLKSPSEDRTQGYLVGLGFWLRTIECCQAATLLIERGFPSAAFPVLRTALECLLFACALWRKPDLLHKLEEGHNYERIKQAKGMISAGAVERINAEKLQELESIADESFLGGSGLTAWEAANAAGLTFEYQTAYRGFGIAGAHASIRSLDDYCEIRSDGSIEFHFGPDGKQAGWLFGLVATWLACGIQRHREALS